MKREYYIRVFKAGLHFEKVFQATCDEATSEGWLLPEFHFSGCNNDILTAVFYKDVK